MNLYMYVGNDPLNSTDPTGRCRLCRAVFNVGRRAIANGGDVRRAGLDEVADIASNVGTVFDPSASLLDKGIAVFDLVSPVTAGEVGQIADAAGDAVRAIDNAGDTAALSRRAGEVHGALDPIAQGRRTTAVVETAEGGRFVGSSEPALSRGQQAALGPGETAARGPGHAEITAANAAEAAGQTPVAVGASRPVCPSCQRELTERGIRY